MGEGWKERVSMMAYRTCLWFGILACVAVSGCKNPKHVPPPPKTAAKPIAVKQAPPTPIETKRVELGLPAWNPGWDTFVERSLPAALLSRKVPRDVRRFCPCFFKMSATDKRAYWAYFFQALAGAEAGLNAKSNVLHSDMNMGTDRVTGERVHSEGLLQLTYEDRERYGCKFNWARDRNSPPHDPRRTILNPENNLGCGIKILTKQIIVERKPLFSASSYWATLRPGSLSYLVFARQMTNPPKACGLREHSLQKEEATRERPPRRRTAEGAAP
jgi:hypothetical protein